MCSHLPLPLPLLHTQTLELSHQQSREIAQHNARTTSTTLNELAWHSASTLTRLAQTCYATGQAAYRNYQFRRSYRPILQQHQQQHINDNPTLYLDELGIPKETHHSDYTSFADESPLNPHSTTTNTSNAPQHDFIFLRPFRTPLTTEGWGAVADLDVFFTHLYHYYYHRGCVPIIGKGVVDVLVLVMTLLLSVVLFVYVDWSALSHCHDEATCHAQLGMYLRHRPLAQVTLWNAIVLVYCLLFSIYTVFACWSLMITVQSAYHAKHIFEDYLGISARKLEGGAVEWDRDVVHKLATLQATQEYRIAINGQDLHALTVANRILRKDNFMVAMVNQGVLDLTVPYIMPHQRWYCASIEVCKCECGAMCLQPQLISSSYLLFSYSFSHYVLLLQLVVEYLFLHTQFHVQPQIRNTTRLLPRSSLLTSPLYRLRYCTRHVHALFTLFSRFAFWIASRLRLEVFQTIFGSPRLVGLGPMDLS
jgi:hypothetical protein